MNAPSVRMYPDVSVLLTLDFEQPSLLRKCTIFKNSIQRQDTKCYQLSSVKAIRNLIVQEVVEAGGNTLRGLWHHLSMAKGGGVPHILDKAVITEPDLLGIQNFFRQKMRAQTRELAKSQIQTQEVWAIDTFRKMETANRGQVPLMSYLQRLAIRLNEYYTEAKNSLLRTEHDLKLLDEEPVNPKAIDVSSLEKALNEAGFDDKEDLNHIASLWWLKQNKGYTPIFATADRQLYERKDIIYEHTEVIVEDALYAASAYKSALSKPWPIRKTTKE